LKLKLFTLLLLSSLLGACKSSLQENAVSVNIPFFKGCERDLESVAEAYRLISEKNDFDLRVERTNFSSVPHSHNEVIGSVSLVSTGDFKSLNGETAKQFLTQTANSLFASCMPDDVVRISDQMMTLGALSSQIKEISRTKTSVYGKLSSEGAVIYYNTGSYRYPSY